MMGNSKKKGDQQVATAASQGDGTLKGASEVLEAAKVAAPKGKLHAALKGIKERVAKSLKVLSAKKEAEEYRKDVEAFMGDAVPLINDIVEALLQLVGTPMAKEQVANLETIMGAAGEDQVVRARVQWTFAQNWVSKAKAAGLELRKILDMLVERGVYEIFDMPEDGSEVRGLAVRVGKKYWRSVHLPADVYEGVKALVGQTNADLRTMQAEAQRAEREDKKSDQPRPADPEAEARRAKYEDAKRRFREGANRNPVGLETGEKGHFIVSIPPFAMNEGEESGPGGEIRLVSDGYSIKVVGSFGNFKFRDLVTPVTNTGGYSRKWLAAGLPPDRVGKFGWLHEALTRGLAQARAIAKTRGQADSLVSDEDSAAQAVWLLDKVPGKCSFRLAKFFVKEGKEGKTRTYHQVAMVVERVCNEDGSTALKLVEVVNDEGLFEPYVGEAITEQSDDPEHGPKPFSGMPWPVRRYLNLFYFQAKTEKEEREKAASEAAKQEEARKARETEIAEEQAAKEAELKTFVEKDKTKGDESTEPKLNLPPADLETDQSEAQATGTDGKSD